MWSCRRCERSTMSPNLSGSPVLTNGFRGGDRSRGPASGTARHQTQPSRTAALCPNGRLERRLSRWWLPGALLGPMCGVAEPLGYQNMRIDIERTVQCRPAAVVAWR